MSAVCQTGHMSDRARVQGRNDSSTSAGGQSSSVAASSMEQGSGGTEAKTDQAGSLLQHPKQVPPCHAAGDQPFLHLLLICRDDCARVGCPEQPAITLCAACPTALPALSPSLQRGPSTHAGQFADLALAAAMDRVATTRGVGNVAHAALFFHSRSALWVNDALPVCRNPARRFKIC